MAGWSVLASSSSQKAGNPVPAVPFCRYLGVVIGKAFHLAQTRLVSVMELRKSKDTLRGCFEPW